MPPPRKKDRLRGSLSPVWEQFPPTRTLCGGQADLPGKSRPDEDSKTAPGGGLETYTPWGNGGQWGCLVAESDLTGHPPGQRAHPGAKTAPGGVGDCAQAAPMGERWAMGVSGAGKAPHWAPAGAEGTSGRKNSLRQGLGTAPMGKRRVMEVSGAGKAPHWAPGGTGGHARAQKQPPAEAGGCLDAGYGCYLPRAIRVIWMHRVGSTARPRIMPS